MSKTTQVMSSISTMEGMAGAPFGNPVSFGDNATGTPYLCVSPLDQSIIDLTADPRMSLTLYTKRCPFFC